MIKMTLLGKIKRRRHHAGGISTAGNVLHMKSVNDLIHKNKKNCTQEEQRSIDECRCTHRSMNDLILSLRQKIIMG